MMDIKEYVSQNPDTVKKGIVSIASIIERLTIAYNAKEISCEEIPNLRMHRFNAVYLPSNEILGLTEEELHIKAIKIPITEDTTHFTTKNFVPTCSSDFEENYIYLAYEAQVGYHYSNSNLLFLEVALERGIAEDDIENGTEEYTSYLFYLKCYLEHTNPELFQE